jgi:hypothetical protein
LIGAAVVLLATFAVTPAHAATGGGCGGESYHTWGHHRACISAVGWGRARPDGYVEMAAGHPPCTITVQAYSSTGQELPESRNTYGCLSGAYSKHVIGAVFERTSGSYRSVVNVIYAPQGSHNAHSPYLNMP